MALYRLAAFLLAGLSAIAGCSAPKPSGQSAPTPVVQALPTTSATADVDRRATLALKQNLLNAYPQNSQGALVEAGLVKDKFECGPNPSAVTERACLRVVREGGCEINTIVRTQPYKPDKAQVIKICETDVKTAK